MPIIFNGEIPCTRVLSQEEVEAGYEKETGKVIVETFRELIL
jgi:L-ribulose-5-phosphate 4-epimerase